VRPWQRQRSGDLWQLDASPHRWFPASNIAFPSLNLLDDCSRLFTASKLRAGRPARSPAKTRPPFHQPPQMNIPVLKTTKNSRFENYATPNGIGFD
jgi:hypothetical protein